MYSCLYLLLFSQVVSPTIEAQMRNHIHQSPVVQVPNYSSCMDPAHESLIKNV